MDAPDYNGHSIVNLMVSLGGALGARPGAGAPDYPELEALSGADIAGAVSNRGTVVLVVIDGLGWEYLQGRPESFLARHARARLSSVFPTTTATAITTYLSGLAPQQHALTGWFTYLKELGTVAAVLPFRSRGPGQDLEGGGVEPRAVFDWTAWFDRLPGPCDIVTADYIRDSAYSRITGGKAERHGYGDLDGFVELTAERALGQPAPGRAGAARGYVYAYWPKLDALAHAHGVASTEVAAHFDALDGALARLAARLAGSDTLLLVSADHGLVDTAPQRTVHVEDHPVLERALTLPLCGEPRAAYCYLRPGRAREFRDYVEGELAACCEIKPSEALLEEGYFGRGTAHPRLGDRIGDYVLLMRENWVIKDRLATERPFAQVGVHGGLSTAERYVPLIVVPA